jgi:hypothetical protein
MEEVEEGGSWKKLKKGGLEEAEEVESWKKLEEWCHGRSGRSGIIEEAQEWRRKKLCRNIAWKIQE